MSRATIGRAKNSARPWVCLSRSAIRAGFEPRCACGNINGSKPARFNSGRNEYHWRAEFFALPGLPALQNATGLLSKERWRPITCKRHVLY
jgi:hypothetical protein